jgi:methionine-rich copper-binding protein CopC/putative copper export protein
MALQPSAAYAHAYVIGSDPVDGSTIQDVPKVIRIYFDASISPLSIAHVYHTEGGQFVEIPTARSVIPANNDSELDTALPSATTLPQGSYFVRWVAVANDDGHTTYGAIGFDVGYSSTGLSGVATLGPSTSNATDSIRTLDVLGILSIAWQWLTLAALTLWLGILITEHLVIARMERGPALLAATDKTSRSLQSLCLSALLIGETVSFMLRIIRFIQVTKSGFDPGLIAQFISTTYYSQLWCVRVVLLLAALALLYWTNHPQREAEPEQRALLQTSREQAARRIVTDAVSTTSAQPRITRDFSLSTTTNGTAGSVKLPALEEHTSVAPTRYLTLFWLTLATAILLTMALGNDISADIPLHASTTILSWLYLAAVGTWFGSLGYIGYVLLPIVQRENLTETLIAFLRHLTGFVLAGMGILVVSGIFLSEGTLHTVSQLLTDPYGRALLAAIVLTALVSLLSLYLLFVLRTRLTRQALLLPVVGAELPARRTRQSAMEQTERQFKRGVETLLLCIGGILLCVALMAFYAPPVVYPNITYSNPTVQPTVVGNTQIQHVGELTISLQVLPGKEGVTNTVIIILTDNNGVPVTNATVLLRINMVAMDMGTAHATIQGGNPTYVATFDQDTSLNMTGVWDIVVTVERPGLPATQALFPVTLN